MTSMIAAIDIGGTKVAGALVARDGSLLAVARRPTPAKQPAAQVLRAVTDVLDELRADPRWAGVQVVGIGSAGPVDVPNGAVSPVNIPDWRDFPLVDAVRAHLRARPGAGAGPGELPIVLTGDGVAIAAAEHWKGAARGLRNVLCMVVSTGVGGGLVIGGAPYPGPTGNAGHIGHISVDLDGDPCPCGSRGCVEILASGTAIARHALRNGWQPAGQDASAVAVAEAARAGDPVALAAFARSAQALAAGIAATATLVELELVVVGGGVAAAGELLFAPLRRALQDYATLPFVRGLEVRPAELGTDAGLVGAAAAAAHAVRLDGWR